MNDTMVARHTKTGDTYDTNAADSQGVSGSHKEAGCGITSAEECPQIACGCNDRPWGGFTFNRKIQCCDPQENVCRSACNDMGGWTGLVWDPRLLPHAASVSECPSYFCQCDDGSTNSNTKVLTSDSECLPQNVACFYWCKQHGG